MNYSQYIATESIEVDDILDRKYVDTNFNEQILQQRVNDWIDGQNKYLYITGISGGGKGYVAKLFKEKFPEVKILELDKFENCLWEIDPNSTSDDPMDQMILDYLKRNCNYRISENTGMAIDPFMDNYDKYHKELCAFLSWFFDTTKDDHNKYIIEGIQIFSDDAFNFLNKWDSIIVLSSTTIYDMVKKMSRPHATYRNKFHTGDNQQKKLRDFIHKHFANNL